MKVQYDDEVTREQVLAVESLVAPEFATGTWISADQDKCSRQLDDSNGQQWWACGRCGSLWHELVNGRDWRPLSCPERAPRT